LTINTTIAVAAKPNLFFIVLTEIMKQKEPVNIMLFRRDLRLHDNASLYLL
jgi:hypothetical protein